MALPPVYRGRFAPSPTGPLHFGSVTAALGSYLEARCRAGEWLLRIEDVDQPRCQAGAAADILRTLEALGFTWDGEVIYQRLRTPRYRAALDQLIAAGAAFPCACSRRELGLAGSTAVDGGPRYPGTCRSGLPRGRSARAWRLRVSDETLTFSDACQGEVAQHLQRDVGDFPLFRADGYFAYQLAVVVDDFEQGVTDVVRGADLLDSTPRQIFLQRCLGLPTPAYAHLPVAVNAAGEKLSKQTHAVAVDAGKAAPVLCAALDFLGQRPPPQLAQVSLQELWAWALAHWDLCKVPRQRTLPAGPQPV
ncbi:MAG: tRNA glutamyl-Q(34) synthetase GluQRS [Rhodocyclaceae bacterium]|nr:tRNA glutamyl-Q(34) synthetase GluQRS [Rhodocyclaceae bacterium]